MAAMDWDLRDQWNDYLREMRAKHPAPAPFREPAKAIVDEMDGLVEKGDQAPLTLLWKSDRYDRDIASVAAKLRQLENAHDQIVTQAAADAPEPVVLGPTLGLRNPVSGKAERVVTRKATRSQFRQWHFRQLRLFATESEKKRWGERVWAYWEPHPEIETIEEVCAAAGIPFEERFAQEIG